MMILAALAGALLFRIRGGLFVSHLLPTWAGRMVWAIGATAVLAWLHQTWSPWLIALVAALFVGCIPGWYGGFDLGRRGGRSYWRDASVLVLRGLWWTLPMLPVLPILDWSVWAAFVGVLTLPSYELAWRVFGGRGPEFGEAIFGGSVLLAANLVS